ncbi:hypothetical protein D6827_03535 [Candidatus Parcubacteria bacterium]|nr:MAG: hypothetical protein D6827_03535 [Candidatus Parcubacteria bacterium]
MSPALSRVVDNDETAENQEHEEGHNMALDTTVGGANSNSYITTAEADTFAGEEYDDGGWLQLTTSDKEKLLIQATEIIDRLNYFGTKYYLGMVGASDYQRLQFPRSFTVDNSNNPIIPENVKRAEFQQARYLLKYLKEAEQRLVLSDAVEQYNVGSLADLNVPTIRETLKSKQGLIAPQAKQYLKPYYHRSPRLLRS